MNYITELQHQENVTLSEAMNIAQQVVARYLPVLHNVIQIKQRTPVTDDEPLFRGAVAHRTSIPQLYEVLKQLHEKILGLENDVATLNHADKQQEEGLAQQLITALSDAAQQCEVIYAGKAASFAMIMHDLQLLSQVLKEKFAHQYQHVATHSPDVLVFDEPASTPDIQVGENEKLVYVRIFHKDMATLANKQSNLNWIKPLLESVRSAEKHGLGVYEQEDDVQRSLKGEAYGYVTIKIDKAQDITHQRPAKMDPAIGCRLLALSNVELNQMVKLTHQAVEYWIRDGMLHKIR